MEFKDFLKLAKKRKILIVSLVGIGLIAGYFYPLLKPAKFESSLSFSINRIHKQDTADYQFDGYYAIQASDLFANTVMSWFLTPSVLLEMYEEAGIEPEIKSLNSFTGHFNVRKYSPQNIVVKFKEAQKERAEKLSQGVIAVAEKKGSEANKDSENRAIFEVEGASPVIVKDEVGKIFTSLIGLISGLIIALAWIVMARYLKEN